jgi:hypothetical protein
MFEGALAQDILPLGSIKLHQVGIDVVDVLTLEANPRVVVRIHVSVSAERILSIKCSSGEDFRKLLPV